MCACFHPPPKKKMNPATEWLGCVAWLAIAELITFASFVPAYRHDWRRWRNVSWDVEFPFMYPPFFLAGGLWFALQAINALGVFFLWRTSSAQGEYHAAMALWVAALGVYSLWAIPWEMEQPPWSLMAWSASCVLSVIVCVLAYFVRGALPGAILLTIYAAALLCVVAFNWTLLVARVGSRKTVLQRRWFNPFEIYAQNYGWPIHTTRVDDGWTSVE